MSLYCQEAGPDAELSPETLRDLLYRAFDRLGDRRRVLAVPPDGSRFHSQAGLRIVNNLRADFSWRWLVSR
jgi:hypothetical protein